MNTPEIIAITGATGFIGQGLIQYLIQNGKSFRAIERQNYLNANEYRGVSCVIHLAGIAHRGSDQTNEYRLVNRDLAVACAEVAAKADVKRFVYLSSIKAVCEFATNEIAINEMATPDPGCQYGISKLAAERALMSMDEAGLIQVCIIRPALVIGAPAKANLEYLIAAATGSFASFWQVIFDGFTAKKSFTSRSNLCQALLLCCGHPSAKGRVFHCADDSAFSTKELFSLIRGLSSSSMRLDTPKKLVAKVNTGEVTRTLRQVVSFFFRLILKILGKQNQLKALSKPLVVDSTRIHRELGWHPQSELLSDLAAAVKSAHARATQSEK